MTSPATPTGPPPNATEEQIFPAEMSDAFGLTMEQWEAYDEPFKISYREYVAVQSKTRYPLKIENDEVYVDVGDGRSEGTV